MKTKRTKIVLLSAICVAFAFCAVLLAIISFPHATYTQLPENIKKISPIIAVNPTSAINGNIIKTNSDFKVTTSSNMSKSEFADCFEIYPKSEYTVSKISGNSFNISFNNNLDPNTLYTVSSIKNGKCIFKWAFQTDNSFGISSHFPEASETDTDSTVSVFFTHADVSNFEQGFSIYPTIDGRFEHHGKRWTFIPSVQFEENVIYTITIASSVCRDNGQALDNDYSFTFLAKSEYVSSFIEPYYASSDNIDTFLPSNNPVATVISHGMNMDEVHVDVYRIPDSKQFIDLHSKYVSLYTVSSRISDAIPAFEKLISFTETPEISESRSETLYIRYPERFENGYYISEIESDGLVFYHIFQVTDLAVYTITTNGDYTVWVNSAETKSSVSGASVSLDGFPTSTTDKKGIAVFNDAQISEDSGKYLTVKFANKPEYVSKIIPTYQDENSAASLNYYSYIYTDSKIYKPGDKIKIWGFILPRKEGAKVPKVLEIYIESTDSKYKVIPDKHGSFNAEINISDTALPCYSFISLESNGAQLCTSGFEVKSYELPTYRLEIQTDKDTYYSGEKIKYTIYSSLFDGTPAVNTEIIVLDANKTIVTDNKGIASFTSIAEFPDYFDNTSTPYVFNSSFEILQPDGSSEIYNSYVNILGSDVFINTQKLNDNSLRINLSTKTNPLYDGVVTAQLHRLTYIKEPAGETYDAVEMKVNRVYNYIENDEIITTESYNTVKGEVTIPIPHTDTDAQYYYLFVSDGIQFGKALSKYYIFDYSLNYGYFEYELKTDKNVYDIGQNVTAYLFDTQNDKKVTDGTVLLSFTGGELFSNEIYTNPENIQFDYVKDFTPDVTVYGAYFDGSKIKFVEGTQISTDIGALNISIKTDKNKYSPGENVNLNIKITDEEGNGKSADAIVSVIDSALYDLYDYDSDIKESVHFSRSNLFAVYRTTSSYIPEPLSDNYGEGGGGGDSVRKEFEVSPCFEKVTTDKNGNASLTFKLPDSITSWDITAKAYSIDARVGQNTIKIPSTKSFFMTVNVSDKIKSDDDVVIPFRFNSEHLSGFDCDYSVTLYKDDIELDVKSGKTNIGKALALNFGKHECGKYKIRVYGKCQNYVDAADYYFEIKDLYLTVPYIYSAQLTEDSAIDKSKFASDITVNIYDEEYKFYYTMLEKLSKLSGNRIEKHISSAIASEFLSGEHFGKMSEYDMSVLERYMNSEIGIQLFSYDSFITLQDMANITAAAGQYFPKQKQIQYYYDILLTDSDLTNALYAYWGLSALGEPVIDELNYIKSKQPLMTDEQELCLALAYAYAGDYTTARNIYNEEIAIKIKSASGIAYFPAQTPDASFVLTELATMLTSKISEKDSKELIKWLISENESLDKCCMEILTYLEYSVLELEGENEVTIVYPDRSQEKITYPRIKNHSIKIKYSDIDRISIIPCSGENCITVAGQAMASGLQADYADITDECSIKLTMPDDLRASDIVGVSLSLSMPEKYEGNHTVSFMLPYVMKFINLRHVSENGFLAMSDGNSIKFEFTEYQLYVEFDVYISAQGEFTMEPIILVDSENQASNKEIKIKIA